MENKDIQKFAVNDKIIISRMGKHFMEVGKIFSIEPHVQNSDNRIYYRVVHVDRSKGRYRADDLQDIGWFCNMVEGKIAEARMGIR